MHGVRDYMLPLYKHASWQSQANIYTKNSTTTKGNHSSLPRVSENKLENEKGRFGKRPKFRKTVPVYRGDRFGNSTKEMGSYDRENLKQI